MNCVHKQILYRMYCTIVCFYHIQNVISVLELTKYDLFDIELWREKCIECNGSCKLITKYFEISKNLR